MGFRINYLCHRFRKKIMQKKVEYCNLIPEFSKRIKVDGGSGVTLMAKIVHKHSQTKASQIITTTMLRLMPSFMLNCAFDKSNSYRAQVRHIQRHWKSKHHNRIRGMLFFIDYHLECMTEKHPHLGIHTQ